MGTIDIVGDGIVHSRVAISIAIIATIAAVDAGNHNGAVEERGVGKGVLLIHQGLLYLRYQLLHILCGETSIVAVGDVVARGPSAVVEVGDMRVGVCGTIKHRNLRHVAYKQHKGRCGIGCSGVGVLALQVGLDGTRGGAHCSFVGVDDIGQEAFASLPLHEGVQIATEHTVGHDEVAHRGGGADRLGIKAVQCIGAVVEGRAEVAVEELFCCFDVGVVVADGDGSLAADDNLAADGVVAHR